MAHRRIGARSRMRRLVDVEQPLLADLGVHLRGRDRRMAEQLLHDAQVGAVVEQVRGARVPQHVRRQLVGRARAASP